MLMFRKHCVIINASENRKSNYRHNEKVGIRGIETAYDVLKNKLCIENISGKKKIINKQDFYAQMLLFNMVEDLKNDANKELEVNRNKELKYEYKVNINILVGTLRTYMIKIALEEDDEKRRQMYLYMMEEIMENLVPIRTGRHKPRKPYTGTSKHKTILGEIAKSAKVNK